MYTPIVIHGRTIETPTRCENRVSQLLSPSEFEPLTYRVSAVHQGKNGMYGHWIVDFDEYECMPYWGAMKDLVKISYFTIAVYLSMLN